MSKCSDRVECDLDNVKEDKNVDSLNQEGDDIAIATSQATAELFDEVSDQSDFEDSPFAEATDEVKNTQEGESLKSEAETYSAVNTGGEIEGTAQLGSSESTGTVLPDTAVNIIGSEGDDTGNQTEKLTEQPVIKHFPELQVPNLWPKTEAKAQLFFLETSRKKPTRKLIKAR
jgi:hypothetical protein